MGKEENNMRAEDITMEEASEFVFHKCEDETINNLINKLSSRAIKSNQKHGNTINNVKKPTIEWVREALEEAMDMAVYLQRLHEKLEKEEINERVDVNRKRLPNCG